MKNVSVKALVLMAFYVALFMVLDTFVNTLHILEMPNGGSLGVSTLALLMASYHLGWKKGLIVSIVSVFAQFVTGPMYTPDLIGFLLDYFIAFSVYGLASIFPNFGYVFTGVFITNLIRFISSTISGVIVWDTTLKGSIIYQASYMVPTMIMGMIVLPLLYKALEPQIKKMNIRK
ncbi:energy-coupled thiamine transporter ThiT [Erysipelotrichaceae bacterium HCN-30851]